MIVKAKQIGRQRHINDTFSQTVQERDEKEGEEAQIKLNTTSNNKQKSSFFPNTSQSKSFCLTVISEKASTQGAKTYSGYKGDLEYSQIPNESISEVVSDESDKQSFFFFLLIMITYYSIEISMNQYYEISEFIILAILLVFGIIQHLLIRFENFKFLHLIQGVSCILVLVIDILWIYFSFKERQEAINLAFDQYPTSQPAQNIVKEQIILSSQNEVRFFIKGAIVFRFQECLSKHLFPLYRLVIFIVSVISFALLFLWKNISLEYALSNDTYVKCLFLLITLTFYEHTVFKRLINFLISLQTLKKYYSLSLCSSSSTHSLNSNTLQIEINPQNLSECKVIYGNQGLSQLLKTNSASFFQDFLIDPLSIQCFDSRGNLISPEQEDPSTSIIDINIEKQVSNPQIKSNQRNGISSKELCTPSRQFIDTKILKSPHRNSPTYSPAQNLQINNIKRPIKSPQQIAEDPEGKLNKFSVGEINLNAKCKQLKKELEKKRSNSHAQSVQNRLKQLSIASQLTTLSQIIKDSRLKSVHLSGKYFSPNENDKDVKYLSITLMKYYNLFQKEIVIASMTDVTAIEEVNNLQKEVQFKEKMFANVTHDLRTPLYAILYSADKLKEIFQINQYSTLPEQRKNLSVNIKSLEEEGISDLHDQINITIANSHLMKAIIQDIIDNNRNRMGKLEPVIHQFDLMEVLNEMKKLSEILLWERRKKIEIIFEVGKEIENNCQIHSDSQRLKQVLMNLISNSIKFTKKGGIIIKVDKIYFKNMNNIEQYVNPQFFTTIKQSQGIDNEKLSSFKFVASSSLHQNHQQFQILQNGLIQFQIIDSGVGMDQKALDNLFTPYNTINKEKMNGHGIGLGLTICKSIVEKLGPFSLKVASKDQTGTKFTFYIYPDLEQTLIKSSNIQDFSKQPVNSNYTFEPGISGRSDGQLINGENNNTNQNQKNSGKGFSWKKKGFLQTKYQTASFNGMEQSPSRQGYFLQNLKEEGEASIPDQELSDQQKNGLKSPIFGPKNRKTFPHDSNTSFGNIDLQKIYNAPEKEGSPQNISNINSSSSHFQDQFRSTNHHHLNSNNNSNQIEVTSDNNPFRLNANKNEKTDEIIIQTCNAENENGENQSLKGNMKGNPIRNILKIPAIPPSTVLPSARCISTDRHSPPVSSNPNLQSSINSINLCEQIPLTNKLLESKVSESMDFYEKNYIDAQNLMEDDIFESAILIYFENNQEHNLKDEQLFMNSFSVNFLPELQQNSNIKKNQQVKFSDSLSHQKLKKSSMEAGSEIFDKKALLLSKIDRQNHVTQFKMTDSIQLNQFKKLKYGQNNSHENEDTDKVNLNVMVCDDSPYNVDILNKLLITQKKFKIKVDSSYSGEDAIRLFQMKNKPDGKEPYNYIFLDWNMPIMDGYETCSRIKFYVKDEQYLDCSIIICSANDDNAEINKCLRSGIDAILPKPVTPNSLSELLQDFQKNEVQCNKMQQLKLNQSIFVKDKSILSRSKLVP